MVAGQWTQADKPLAGPTTLGRVNVRFFGWPAASFDPAASRLPFSRHRWGQTVAFDAKRRGATKARSGALVMQRFGGQ